MLFAVNDILCWETVSSLEASSGWNWDSVLELCDSDYYGQKISTTTFYSNSLFYMKWVGT